jgi:hypothetical protein
MLPQAMAIFAYDARSITVSRARRMNADDGEITAASHGRNSLP